MNEAEKLTRLRGLLAGLAPEDIYRSVYDHEGKLLVEGLEPLHSGLAEDFKKVPFQGKTVIDLGCNFGLFSFLAAQYGAKEVTGVDSLAEAVEGATLLAALKGVDNVAFEVFDFEQPQHSLGPFDLVMLVDFFGRSNIRKTKVRPIIAFMESISAGEMLFAIRPLNRIKEDLKMSEAAFSRLYAAPFIADGYFHLLDYITDILGSSWSIEPLGDYDGSYHKYKILFLCRKKG